MCGFNVIKNLNNNLEFINYHSQKRGPDKTTIKNVNDITFIHNLLHITGKTMEQPFIKNNIVCLFNGEIYNYKDFNESYNSDGMCLIDLYQKYDINFTKYLDGEFAIVLFDFNKNIFIISTDIFSTKPLFYSIENDNFMISSYSSCIDRNKMTKIKKLEANKTIKFNLLKLKQIEESIVYKFDLIQHKDNYNDWIKAFENSIKKRTQTNKKFFVSLSSGYDSGAICIALNKLKTKYKTYTIMGKENSKILNKRFKINCVDYFKHTFDPSEELEIKNRNNKNCCDFEGSINKKKKYSVFNDKASIGGSYIYNKARKENYIINLSGQGADEILSDYGFNGKKIKSHSCFGGKFPENLKDIFPWTSFFGGIGQCLLMKEEIIGGSHGIENRYPFLDKQVVQEFLWLKNSLKNKYYKAPLHIYLSKNNYPFDENKKIGFNNLY